MTTTFLPITEFTERRQRFLAQMPENSVALFAANSEVTRSNDTEYPFCQDKSFYYLTGFNEPDAVLVLVKTDTSESILFCREKDPLEEVWHGRRIGAEKAQQAYQFDQAFGLSVLEEQLKQLMADKLSLWYCHNTHPIFEQQIMACLAQVKAQERQGVSAPDNIFDCSKVINEMRLIKSSAELDIMRKVNLISGRAHQRAMEKCRAGMFEYQIEAELLHEFAQHGAKYPAYGSIVAGGDNANILHYTNNDDMLSDGDLLLIDAGGELAGYAADITRTFPVSGKFSEPQKALYELVLAVQQQTIAAVKPGQTLAQLNDLACEILTKGLLELGILKGELEKLIEDKACKKYFIHGLGHWLGLDVHDVGDYQFKDKRQQRKFQPGMVLTIEPGLYFPQDDISVEAKWRGIGIRIEDNIAVTDLGHDNLTVNAPKSVKEIESIMAAANKQREQCC